MYMFGWIIKLRKIKWVGHILFYFVWLLGDSCFYLSGGV